ncbi:MAG: DUF21 domain-containing protein [Deltaproteobacteria bacterium]|nr:DUF21 domain-containing protein [Deltaproteobacteria bacterium]
MEVHWFWWLLTLPFFLILSAFFSGSETGLMTMNRIRLHHLSRQGNASARYVEAMVQKPEHLLSTLLVGNNIVNIAATSIATAIFIRFFGERGVLIATIAMTVLLLIFSEILPKTYAAIHTEGVALKVIYPVRLCMWILYPIVRLATLFTRFVFRVFGTKSQIQKYPPTLTEEDIRTMVLMGEGVALPYKKLEMLRGILDLGSTTAGDIRIHRSDMVVLDITEENTANVEKMIQSGHSRFPIVEGPKDEVIGLIYTKDVLKCYIENPNFDIKSIIRPAYFVPRSRPVQSLLGDFQKGHYHMAIVVNEYGGVDGLITLEDIIEVIVGEISDEYELAPELLEVAPDGTVQVDGTVRLRDLNRELQWDLPEEEGFQTVAGLLLTELEHIPKMGEEIKIGGYEFRVISATPTTVRRLRIKKLLEEEESDVI